MKRLLIIDLMALFHRSRCAMRTELTTKNGTSCRGTYVLLRSLLNEIKGHTHVAIATEGFHSTSSNRTISSDYKANRGKQSSAFWEDYSICRKAIDALRIPVFSVDGEEADDTIASLVDSESSDYETITILTCDSDFFQLIGEDVIVRRFTSSKKITDWDEDKLAKELRCTPWEYPQLKSMTGDDADNIPGIRGIGNATAAKILNEAHADGIPWYEHDRVKDHVELLRQNLELITLSRRLDLPEDPIPAVSELDYDSFFQLTVGEYGFKSFKDLR